MPDNTTNNKNVRDDEIDLLDLFKRMGRALTKMFNALGKAFLISVVFLIRRWLPLGLSILAGIGVSYYLKNASTSSYTTDLVIRNNLAQLDRKGLRDVSGTTYELYSKIGKLHELCMKRDINELSHSLSMNPDSIKSVTDINAYWIIDLNKDGVSDFVDYEGNHNVYDSINIRMPSKLDIQVMTKSSFNINKLKDGIIKFIENDSLFENEIRLRLKQNNELLTRLSYDIKQLDSLQKVKYFEETRNVKPDKGGQIVFMTDQKTQLVYNDIYALYSRKHDIETENILYKGVVTVLSDFSSPVLVNNGIKFYAKQVVLIFFLVTLLILILLANRKKLIEVYKKY